MRRIALVIGVVAALAGAYGLGRRHSPSQAAGKTGRRILYYTDPMHPAYKSDKPGIAPDCGMDLVPVYADAQNAASVTHAELPSGAVGIDSATRQLLGIRLASVEKTGSTRVIRVIGRVVPEDTRTYRVNSGVDGVVQQTYNDSLGMPVKKDQKLAVYYSPDFLQIASGFLAASAQIPGSVGGDGSRTVPFPGAVSKQGVSSLQGYADRLRNLGMSDVQIKRMADNRQLPESVDVVSPADGFILARNISAGQHFERNGEFYRIADLSKVWVVAEMDEADAASLRPGAVAQVVMRDAGRRLQARVTDSLPESEVASSIVKLRLEVDNPTFVLRPEMLVDVEVSDRLSPAVTVPLDAVIDSGVHARVYVERSEGVFEPREVETGWRYGERVEVRRGLTPGERVVAAATFLVDSESRLRTPAAAPPLPPAENAVGAIQHAAAKTVKDPSCGMAVDPAQAVAAGHTLNYHGVTYYFCSQQCKSTFENTSAASAGVRRGEGDD